MRLARCLVAVLVCSGLSCASPPRAAARRDTPPGPPIVVGTGNRVSGRVDVTWIGDPSHAFAAAVDSVARSAAGRGLTVTCTRVPHLGARVPTSAVVATTWPVAAEDADALAAYRRAGRGVVVLVDADLGTVTDPLGETRYSLAQTAALDALDPHAPSVWGDAPKLLTWPDESDVTHLVAAGPGTDPAALALSVLRHTILRANGATYLPTAFGDITGETKDDRVAVTAPTLVAGEVTMDVISLDGATLLEPGPLRPIDVKQLADVEGALVRLRLAGDGFNDEARVWLRDLMPLTFETARLSGFSHVPVGEPALYRVALSRVDGSGVEGCTLDATFGDSTASATTDSTGTAVIRFPGQAMTADGSRQLVVTSRERSRGLALEASISIRERTASCVVQTDRPLYRPGGIVKFRAFVLSPAGRPTEDAVVSVTVYDARDRVVRTFAARTDEFGAVTCEMPIAARVSSGSYRVHVNGDGIVARTTFVVDDAARLPFDVGVELATTRPVAGERLRGAVTIRDWDGVEIRGATVRVGLDEAELKSFAGDGRAEFDVAVPPRTTPLATTLRVEVESAGSVVTSETPIVVTPTPADEQGDLAVGAVPTTEPGAALDVAIRSRQPAAIVDVDLVSSDRVLAATSVQLADGAGRAHLSVPADAAGPAQIVVRRRDGVVARTPVFVGRPALDVVLAAPALAAPGDDVDAQIRVRDRQGRSVPALLDVRGADRAYRAAAGISSLDPHAAADGASPGDPDTLATDDGMGPRVRFEHRVETSGHAALQRATESTARDAPAMPWGSPIFPGEFGGALCVMADTAVTRRAGPGAATVPQRFVETVQGASRSAECAELLPRQGATIVRADGFRPGRWLQVHQSPDGSWHPARFLDLCWTEGCDGPAPSRFHVATTSLALLCFLGVGETHQSGTCRNAVKNGLLWLRRRQQPDGFVGDRETSGAALNHALAALALTEAYGMTGSRVFKEPAQKAANVVAAMQRPDGSFAEAGATDGSVILGTFCVMALKSALISELDADKTALVRYVGWLDAHTDAATGAPSLSDEERAIYPFGGVSARRTAAAASLLSRAYAGATAATDPVLTRAADTILLDLARGPAQDDPLSVYFATLAMFQMGDDGWRRWNDSMKTAVVDHQVLTADRCSRGSWPGSGRLGRLMTTEFECLCMEVYYRYGRVLGNRDDARRGGGAAAPEPRVRHEFPDLLVSDLALRTDERGERALRLHVPDQITTWDVGVGAWDSEGRYGRATAEICASLPLFATVALPPHLHRGDVVRVPIAVRSTLETDADCTIAVTRADGLELVEAPEATLHVAPGATVAAFATFTVTGPSQSVLEVLVTGGGRADSVRATADVGSTRRPFASSVPVTVGTATRVEVNGATDAHAVLRVRGTVLGAATSSLAALIRRPHGCFEQVSATLYPALLAWRYLGASADDPRIEYLRDGYQQLLTFEARGGGFALWPDKEPRADLTALGIHELIDLAPVVGVDDDVVRRAGEYLAANLPADPAQRLYAIGALRRLSTRVEVGPLDLNDDPYLVALALTQDLLFDDAAKHAVQVLRRAAVRNAAGAVSWHSTAAGLFRGEPPRDGETTALVIEALVRRGDDVALARAGAETLRASIRSDGAWDDTRETVAALGALRAVAETAAKGRLIAEVKGRAPLAADLTADVAELDLGPWTAADELTLRFEGEGSPWATLDVRGSVDSQTPAAPSTTLALAVEWPTEPLRLGAKGVAKVELANLSPARVTAPLVVVALPGGVAVDRRALERAATAAGFSYVEVEAGAVRLYCTELASAAKLHIDIPFTAQSAGSFSTGVASAAPYYDPAAMAWTTSRRVEVRAE